jgi:methyltransferase family protein
LRELSDAISMFDLAYLCNGQRKTMLELGAGIGMYIPLFLNEWAYTAVEKSAFCIKWLQEVYSMTPLQTDVETFLEQNWQDYDCIFAAHIIEHLKDAPSALMRCFERVRERIYIIVPDDQDPTNPDHQWFFSEPTLRNLLLQIGFKNVRTQVRRRIPREQFIYCVAEK